MDPITAKLMSAAGVAADRIYVNDVFSTFLYDGTGTAQTITNGIDLSGEGGMVIIKNRPRSIDGFFTFDTERGAGKYVRTNLSGAENTSTDILSAFSSTGFTVGTSGSSNRSGDGYCSWTFRKCPGFFDIVTYTGDGTAGRQISHSIGSTPGFVIVKRRDAGTTNWHTWHRSHGDNKRLELNNNNVGSSSSDYVRTASSTTFTVGSDYDVNGNNGTFVAYIFAHNDQSFGAAGNEAAIHCGSYTANESTNGVEIDCGFEAQWVMVKNIDAGENWVLVDDLRGFSSSVLTNDPMNGNTGKFFEPNTSGSESTGRTFVATPDGFQVTSTAGAFGSNNTEYIYIAIAKNNKVPEAGSEVFETDIGDSTTSGGVEFQAGFPVDMFVYRNFAGGGSGHIQSHNLITRKYQKNALYTNRGEDMNYLHTPGSEALLDNSVGAYAGTLDEDHCAWMWRTAPGFFDVTNYWNGDDTNNRTIKHNLRAVPKMMWIKSADDADSIARNWCVYHEVLGNTKKLILNSSAAATNTDDFSDTSPTATNFTVGAEVSVNKNAEYIAFMFGEVEGVSKIGSYTGNGTNQNIDCGFSAGARFILIKRTDATGDWLQFDTERGINAGAEDGDNWNSSGNTKNNDADSIDTFSSGFNVVQNSTHNLNVSGATYVFYAIS